MIYILVSIAWVVCGVLAYGHELAWTQRWFPAIAKRDYRIDCQNALCMAVIGPFGLIVSLAFVYDCGRGCGFMYSRPHEPKLEDFYRSK